MGAESIGRWFFDSTTESASTFRICGNCGAVFHIMSGDNEFRFCPYCGQKKQKNEEANENGVDRQAE